MRCCDTDMHTEELGKSISCKIECVRNYGNTAVSFAKPFSSRKACGGWFVIQNDVMVPPVFRRAEASGYGRPGIFQGRASCIGAWHPSKALFSSTRPVDVSSSHFYLLYNFLHMEALQTCNQMAITTSRSFTT
ncbi:hypothetical protein BD410DRAFT_373621 [Rickenella mellea]|uniref:Uncharacterized protein n=1 Tax=Rickenella mellea TaxID=50990 RepID=A0A4Y7PYL4_9AGAM|nr:hypothetical protein BD410DRAFT_373621 [Rickenella mellea]